MSGQAMVTKQKKDALNKIESQDGENFEINESESDVAEHTLNN